MNQKLVLAGIAAIALIGAGVTVLMSKKENRGDVYSAIEEQNFENNENLTDEESSAQQNMKSTKSGFQVETPPHTPQSQVGVYESRSGGESSVPPTASSDRDSKTTANAKPAVKHGCVTRTFTHKQMSSHSNGVACGNHNNLFSLKEWDLNPKSVCVRVNGTPVTHKISKNSKKKNFYVTIGSVAGPNSRVTVSYCDSRTTCNEPCKVPRDKFLEAIGGAMDSFADNSQSSGWDGTSAPSKTQKKLAKELKGLQSELAGVGNTAKAKSRKAIFRSWIQRGRAPACLKAMRATNDVRVATRRSR